MPAWEGRGSRQHALQESAQHQCALCAYAYADAMAARVSASEERWEGVREMVGRAEEREKEERCSGTVEGTAKVEMQSWEDNEVLEAEACIVERVSPYRY